MNKIPREELWAIAISALILITFGFVGGYAARQISTNDKVLITQIENQVAQKLFYEEQYAALQREFKK